MGLGGAHPEVERWVESEQEGGQERDLLRGGPGRKGGTDCRICLFWVFLLPFLFGNHTVALKDTSPEDPRGVRGPRGGNRWPLCSILLTRQEHPPRKAPLDKPLTSSRGQYTVACLGLEVHKSRPKSERSDRLK